MAGWRPGAHLKLHRLQLYTAPLSMHVKASSVAVVSAVVQTILLLACQTSGALSLMENAQLACLQLQ